MICLRQGDPRWAKELQGDAPYGSLLTCLAMALNDLNPPLGAAYTPKTLQDLLASKDVVWGDLEEVARSLGLVCREAERTRLKAGDPRLSNLVLAGLSIDLKAFGGRLAINRGPDGRGLCILQTVVGEDDVEHFILAHRWFKGKIECADPAAGASVLLDARTLLGVSEWTPGDLRTYRVTGTIPIRSAA